VSDSSGSISFFFCFFLTFEATGESLDNYLCNTTAGLFGVRGRDNFNLLLARTRLVLFRKSFKSKEAFFDFSSDALCFSLCLYSFWYLLCLSILSICFCRWFLFNTKNSVCFGSLCLLLFSFIIFDIECSITVSSVYFCSL
jgi:hypothetical protein